MINIYNFIFQCDWDSVINDNVNVDDACNKFTNIFFDFCKECTPRKKVLIVQMINHGKIWN